MTKLSKLLATEKTLSKQSLKNKAKFLIQDRSSQEFFLTKVADVVSHLSRFEEKLKELDHHSLASVNNWKKIAINLIQIAKYVECILVSNALAKKLSNLPELFHFIDRFIQIGVAFAQATYTLISDLKHHFFVLGTINGLGECKHISLSIKIDGFIEGFHSKFCSKIYSLARQFHNIRLDFNDFVAQTTDKLKIKKRGVEVLLQIYNYVANTLKIAVQDHKIERSIFAGIITKVIDILNNKNTHLEKINRRQSFLCDRFFSLIGNIFNRRRRAIEKFGLIDKVDKPHEQLTKQQTKSLAKVDKKVIIELIQTFLSFIGDEDDEKRQKFDFQIPLKEQWESLQPHHKIFLKSEIDNRTNSFFYDYSEENCQLQKEKLLFGENISSSEKVRHPLRIKSKLNIDNVIEIMKDTTCFDTEAFLIRALVKTVPNFKKDHPDSEYHSVIFIEKNEEKSEVRMDRSLDYRYKKGLLIKTKAGAYYKLASKQGLIEDDWQFGDYGLTAHQHEVINEVD